MMRNTNPALLKDLIQESMRKRYPKSVLDHFEFQNVAAPEEPFIARMEGTINQLAQAAGPMLLMDQEDLLDPALNAFVTFEERLYPVFLGFGEIKSWEGVIEPPAGYSVKSIPTDISIVKPFGSYERHYELSGDKLTGKMKIVIEGETIPLEQYQEFKSFIETVSLAEKEKIIFEKV
jgi:hypothetical protein